MIIKIYNEYAVYIRVKPSFDTSIEWSHQRALELNMIKIVQWQILWYQPMLYYDDTCDLHPWLTWVSNHGGWPVDQP